LKDFRRYVGGGFPCCHYLNIKGKECYLTNKISIIHRDALTALKKKEAQKRLKILTEGELGTHLSVYVVASLTCSWQQKHVPFSKT
jgi:hypothetical protein